QDLTDQRLRLRAGNEHPSIDHQNQVAKVGFPLDVLQRLVAQATLEPALELRQLIRGERAVELEVEVQPPNAEASRQEQLTLQPRIGEAPLLEIAFSPADQLHRC